MNRALCANGLGFEHLPVQASAKVRVPFATTAQFLQRANGKSIYLLHATGVEPDSSNADYNANRIIRLSSPCNPKPKLNVCSFE
jgi:hypothetical protein